MLFEVSLSLRIEKYRGIGALQIAKGSNLSDFFESSLWNKCYTGISVTTGAFPGIAKNPGEKEKHSFTFEDICSNHRGFQS